MGSYTLTEPELLVAPKRTADDAGRCALLSLVPSGLAQKLRAALCDPELDAVEASTPEALRDALFDRDVVAAFVHFGRDVPQGVATCRAIRRRPSGDELPIIAIIEPGIAEGFPPDAGIDDVLLTPFLPEEAALRVRLALWRKDVGNGETLVKIGDLVVDFAAMRVRFKGAPVDLTYKEFALLRHFLVNPGVALRRAQILDAVWGDDYFGGDRTVDIHVRRLRAKLPPLAEHIETVHGVGYRYSAAVEIESDR